MGSLALYGQGPYFDVAVAIERRVPISSICTSVFTYDRCDIVVILLQPAFVFRLGRVPFAILLLGPL